MCSATVCAMLEIHGLGDNMKSGMIYTLSMLALGALSHTRVKTVKVLQLTLVGSVLI